MSVEGFEDKPAQGLVRVHGAKPHIVGNHPLDEIVDSLKAPAFAYGQLAGPPEGARDDGRRLHVPGAPIAFALEIQRSQGALVGDPFKDLVCEFPMLGDKDPPPWTISKLSAAETKDGPVFHGLPTRLVTEVLEKRLTRLQQILGQRRVEPVQS